MKKINSDKFYKVMEILKNWSKKNLNKHRNIINKRISTFCLYQLSKKQIKKIHQKTGKIHKNYDNYEKIYNLTNNILKK